MTTTFNETSRFQHRTGTGANSQVDAATVHEPHFDLSLAGAGAAILVWMALFAGFLFSWFTMGSL